MNNGDMPMNFIAHLYFADDAPDSFLGSLLGDFVKGNAYRGFNARIAAGIKLHRKIDKYTDAHPIFKLSKSRFSQKRRRFAGVLTDIFYDHFLARNWNRFSETPFSWQTDHWYQGVRSACCAGIPEEFKSLLDRIIRNDLLGSYRTVKGIGLAVDRLALRIHFENSLHGGGEELVRGYRFFEEDFYRFFPRLIEYVEKIKAPKETGSP